MYHTMVYKSKIGPSKYTLKLFYIYRDSDGDVIDCGEHGLCMEGIGPARETVQFRHFPVIRKMEFQLFD